MGSAKTGGGIGTNQYVIRGRAKASIPAPMSADQFRRLAHLDITPDGLQRKRYDLTCLPACPPEVFEAFWRDHPQELGEYPLQHCNPDMLIGLAANPNCPEPIRSEVLAVLFSVIDPDDIRFMVVHQNCTPALLNRLAIGPNRVLRAHVALRPDCPIPVLSKLAGDREWPVRRAVAQHPRCPIRMLVTMADDTVPFVRTVALANSRMPEHIKVITTLGARPDIYGQPPLTLPV